MIASANFIPREIAGEYLLVPTGAASAQLNGLITLNELGYFIFQTLQSEQSIDSLVSAITAEYDVDADTARADALEFLAQLRAVGALTERAE